MCMKCPLKMKVTTILLLTINSISILGQSLPGKYNAYYGHSLELKDDSTFRYEWKFDLIKNWAIGRWTVSNDMVYLEFNDIYDTLKRSNKADSSVLSNDEKSNCVNDREFAIYLISSGGQRHDGITNCLAIKGKRLYLVNKNGRVIKTKQSGIWTKKKRPTYYFKMS